MLQDNLGISLIRSMHVQGEWNHSFVCGIPITPHTVSGGVNYLFPLYLYAPEKHEKVNKHVLDMFLERDPFENAERIENLSSSFAGISTIATLPMFPRKTYSATSMPSLMHHRIDSASPNFSKATFRVFPFLKNTDIWKILQTGAASSSALIYYASSQTTKSSSGQQRKQNHRQTKA